VVYPVSVTTYWCYSVFVSNLFLPVNLDRVIITIGSFTENWSLIIRMVALFANHCTICFKSKSLPTVGFFTVSSWSLAQFLKGLRFNSYPPFSLPNFSFLPLLSTFDLTVLVMVIFISYFGGTHKPKWLGAGVFIQGIGTLLYAFPQFIASTYDVGKDANLTFEECRDESDFSPECRDSDNIYFFVYSCSYCAWCWSCSLFTVGTSYIDDLVHPKHAFGIFYTWAVVGPGLGFGIGGGFLSVYVDGKRLHSKKLGGCLVDRLYYLWSGLFINKHFFLYVSWEIYQTLILCNKPEWLKQLNVN